MFLSTEILNEGKVFAKSVNSTKTRLSEGKNPKSILTGANTEVKKSIKTQCCVNSNWQKLRG